MLDIQFIRDNPKLVQEKSAQKNVDVDIAKLIELDDKRRALIVQIESVRADRNQLNASHKGKVSDASIKKGTELKAELTKLEAKLRPIEDQFTKLLRRVPNMPTEDVPVGKSEEDNVVVKHWGTKKDFDYQPKTHWEIGEAHDLIDKERGAKVSGSRFAYIKGGLVELEFALISYAIRLLGDSVFIEELIKKNNLKLVAKPFTPVLPPAMVRTEIYEETGRLKAEEQTYKLADDDLWLIASAEHSLCSMYENEILKETDLPIRYLGFTTNFRREAGTYGKDANGIIRMHQFDKLEMEVFSTPETSFDEHMLLIAIQEYIYQELELPYRLIMKCTADIGDPNARGVDIDTWMPGQGVYKETHTADYMGDYQARSLKTRFARTGGGTELVHTNDATAIAMARTLAAIIENYQTEDGHILIPEVLKPYLAGREQI